MATTINTAGGAVCCGAREVRWTLIVRVVGTVSRQLQFMININLITLARNNKTIYYCSCEWRGEGGRE